MSHILGLQQQLEKIVEEQRNIALEAFLPYIISTLNDGISEHSYQKLVNLVKTMYIIPNESFMNVMSRIDATDGRYYLPKSKV